MSKQCQRGLGKQADKQGKGRLVGELIQNALDEMVAVIRIEDGDLAWDT